MPPTILNPSFDFTSDSPGYWDGFWDVDPILGNRGVDPDAVSPALREYHRILWSRPLPNGQHMQLVDDGEYLSWDGMRFSSDSIIASFRYQSMRELLEQVAASMDDYHGFIEDYLHRSNTIGGFVIFPKHQNSINQIRGRDKRIRDRWDLTLECIRRHYAGEESPLSEVLRQDAAFFDLFVDFEGYIDFFFLQDCIDPETGKVRFWLGDGTFGENPLPKTVDEYLSWITNELDFVQRRNQRIAAIVTECFN